MGWFSKKDKVIDLTEGYIPKKNSSFEQNEIVDLSPNSSSPQSSEAVSPFGAIFGGANNSSTDNGLTAESSNSDPAEKRQRLAKRLRDMTDKLEDISNQIYHLQQRIEVLERKSESGY